MFISIIADVSRRLHNNCHAVEVNFFFFDFCFFMK